METPQRTARPQEPADPPRLVGIRDVLNVGAGYLLRLVAGALSSGSRPALAGRLLLLLGLLLQLVLLWLAGEILDLYVSAVELWAELARKHLELTM
jgi:hypothetical protein